MKRIFYIGGLSKEAPAGLKETPQLGSLVSYGRKLFKVTDVVYYMESGEIHIILNPND